MFNEILALFSSSFNAAVNWFSGVFDRTGAIPIYMGIIVIFMAMRYIISPIVGSGLGSDIARKVKDDDDG